MICVFVIYFGMSMNVCNLVETFVSGYHGIGSHVEDHLIEQGLNAIRKETERYDDFLYVCIHVH